MLHGGLFEMNLNFQSHIYRIRFHTRENTTLSVSLAGGNRVKQQTRLCPLSSHFCWWRARRIKQAWSYQKASTAKVAFLKDYEVWYRYKHQIKKPQTNPNPILTHIQFFKAHRGLSDTVVEMTISFHLCMLLFTLFSRIRFPSPSAIKTNESGGC